MTVNSDITPFITYDEYSTTALKCFFCGLTMETYTFTHQNETEFIVGDVPDNRWYCKVCGFNFPYSNGYPDQRVTLALVKFYKQIHELVLLNIAKVFRDNFTHDFMNLTLFPDVYQAFTLLPRPVNTCDTSFSRNNFDIMYRVYADRYFEISNEVLNGDVSFFMYTVESSLTTKDKFYTDEMKRALVLLELSE